MPKWTGKALAPFPSVPPCPPHLLPQGLPHCRWTPNCGWVLLGVGTPPLPQLPLRGAGPIGPAFTFALPSLPPSHSLRTHEAGGGLGGQRIRPGISAGSWGPKWAGETWPCSLLILCPPNGSPITPSGVGSLPLPQLPLRGASPVPPPLLLPLHSPHSPCPTLLLGVSPWGHPLGVHGPPPVPGRCPSCEETRIP